MSETNLTADPRLSAPMRRHLRSLHLDTVEAYRAWCRENGFNVRLNKTLPQRRRELASSQKATKQHRIDTDLEAHLTALGLGTIAEYQAWCRAHGAGEGLQKSKAQRRQEIQLGRQARSREKADRSSTNQHRRRRKDLLKRIAAGEVDERELTSPVLLRVRHLFQNAPLDPKARSAFLALLLHVERLGRLFHLKPIVHQYGPQPANNFMDGLASLAAWHGRWLRRVETWKPDSHNGRRQFGGLARHLLAEYDVPSCMDTAFFTGMESGARTRQGWFVHVGAGNNIRKAAIPLRFTRRMAHAFIVSAPSGYTVDTALRWAQVIGMGGDDLLAEAVCDSLLGDRFEEETFWETVLHFFVNHPMLDVTHVGPIVDYIHHQRTVVREQRDADGSVCAVGTPDPDFTMKGRTPESMLRRVDAWHRGMNRSQPKHSRQWESCGVNGYTWVDEDERAGEIRTWRIEEIRNSRDLAYEGKHMKHCVASYLTSCANGTRSIWSMKVEYLGSGATRNVMTIELLNNRKYIRQVRGRGNSRPTDAHSGRAQEGWNVLCMWADQERLTLPGARSWAMRRV